MRYFIALIGNSIHPTLSFNETKVYKFYNFIFLLLKYNYVSKMYLLRKTKY